MRASFKLALLTALLALGSRAQAYVTSAILEYTCDDQAAFYLNGSPILGRSDFAPFNVEVLSTSDGTLPMELFNPYGDNLFAVENYDVEGYNMSISYRLTVHQSDGDPIVIWSDPSQAKMLHLTKAQADPAGWNQAKFDDGAWAPAATGTILFSQFDAFFKIPDPAFSGVLSGGYVPRLAHNFNLKCNTGDHNLFRSHFRFPDKQAKVLTLVNPPQAVKGTKVAVRLVPGPDSAEFSQFNVLAWLPQGLDFVSASEGVKYDANLRRLSWSFGKRDLEVKYATLPAQSILNASGWSSAEKALGPKKAGKGRRKLNTPDSLWNDGAGFTSGRPGWFKIAPHGVDLSQWRPIILGVIFHSQIRLGGKDMGTKKEADAILFNYSVDGSTREALKDDIEVSRMTANDYWIDGYYDATEDRKWTWEDLSRLAVKLEAKARGSQDKNLVASMGVTVKYYLPSKASPYFYATVSEPKCSTLKLNAGVFRAGAPLLSSDPTDLKVNLALCPATPVPTPIPTPIPKQQMVAPTPQPTQVAGLDLKGENRFQLGCLNLNPSPFTYAGSFVQFCVKKDVDVTLNIYSSATGKLARQIKGGAFRPGDNQIFYNALDDAGKLLQPGDYTFELIAEKDGFKEIRNGVFRFAKKKGN